MFGGTLKYNCCPQQMIKPKPEGLFLKACPLTVSTLHTSHFLRSNHSHRVSVTNEGAGKNKLMVFLITLVGLNLSEKYYHESYHCDFLQNLVFVIFKIVNILFFSLVLLTLNQWSQSNHRCKWIFFQMKQDFATFNVADSVIFIICFGDYRML